MMQKTERELELELLCWALVAQLKQITNQFGYAWPGMHEEECKELIARAEAVLEPQPTLPGI